MLSESILILMYPHLAYLRALICWNLEKAELSQKYAHFVGDGTRTWHVGGGVAVWWPNCGAMGSCCGDEVRSENQNISFEFRSFICFKMTSGLRDKHGLFNNF